VKDYVIVCGVPLLVLFVCCYGDLDDLLHLHGAMAFTTVRFREEFVTMPLAKDN
jgi:hypothetical protein